MGKIAVVSFGSAGASVMREMLSLSSDYEAFNVNEQKGVEEAKFFSYEELELLSEELASFDCVVLTAGLGSRGGDALVEIYEKLVNVRKLCFLITPFYFEIERLMRSRHQLCRIMNENFEGAVVTLNILLGEMEVEVEGNPGDEKAKLEVALKKFDRDFAAMILDMMREIK